MRPDRPFETQTQESRPMNPLPTEQQPTATPNTTVYQPPTLTRYGSLVGVTQSGGDTGKNLDAGVDPCADTPEVCYS